MPRFAVFSDDLYRHNFPSNISTPNIIWFDFKTELSYFCFGYVASFHIVNTQLIGLSDVGYIWICLHWFGHVKRLAELQEGGRAKKREKETEEQNNQHCGEFNVCEFFIFIT